MEGHQVGQPVAGQVNQHLASQSATTYNIGLGNDLQFLWPRTLMAELADRNRTHSWGMLLALGTFIATTLLGIAVGPLQLIVLVLTQDYNFVTEVYAPNVLKVALLVSGLLAISAIVAMILTWKEQPKRSLMTGVLGTSTIVTVALIWLAGFAIHFEPNGIAFAMLITIIGGWVLTIVTSRHYFASGKSILPLQILLSIVITLGALETIFCGIYLFSQTGTIKEEQSALDGLAQAQAAARIDGITSDLSDLVYALCSGPFDAVFIPANRNNLGIFECRVSHEVYAASGPNESTTSNKSIMLGSAFYFGKTYDGLVAEYFPIESGAKYLYRDLSTSEDLMPSELVLLLAAPDEEVLINSYIDQLTGFINARVGENQLLLSIFYTNELNTVVNTRDFILIAAADTIALRGYFPHGSNIRSYLNGGYGTYIFTPDLQLPALRELGLSPLLYSSQTRDAINSRRHITVTIEPDHEYTTDEIRELLYANFIDPNAGDENPNPDEPASEEPPAQE